MLIALKRAEESVEADNRKEQGKKPYKGQAQTRRLYGNEPA